MCDPGTPPDQKAAAMEAIVTRSRSSTRSSTGGTCSPRCARSQYAELGSTYNQKRMLAMLEDRVEGFRDGLGAASSVDPLFRKWIEEFETSTTRAQLNAEASNARANARGKANGGWQNQGRGKGTPKGANAKPALPRVAASE